MSLILNIKDYKTSYFKLCPKKLNKPNSYNLTPLYCNRPFMVQSPICTIDKIIYDDDPKTSPKALEISFNTHDNFIYLQFFELIDKLFYEFSKTFVVSNGILPASTDITKRFHPGSYISDDNSKYIIQIKLNQQTTYFDANKNMIPCDISVGDKVVLLFLTKGIFLDTQAINYRWTAKQILTLNSIN